MNLSIRDKKIIWHPLTQEKTAPLPIAIKRGEGSYLYDENDNKYLDLISSWWVNLHGHCHPKIAQAIYEQAMQLEHVIFAGFTHEPAVQLCENIGRLLPNQLTRFFFSDNGSTTIEIALKLAYQYWANNDCNNRTSFICFEGGYHGDTMGAMSVGTTSSFHNSFKGLLFEVSSIPFPKTWDNDPDVEKKEKESLLALEKLLHHNANKISSIILEPLVQGASGMKMCRPSFIKNIVEMVRQFDILVIFDEVMTGFGRTGTNFAFEQIGIVPDFLCISKGITGGFLPLALTVTSEKIFAAFLGDDFTKAFTHSHSYTANPLGCAAALASLEILTSTLTQKAIANINQAHIEGLKFLRENCDKVYNTRITGTIAAFDLKKEMINPQLKAEFLDQGLLLRPIGNVIYLLPPYCITASELQISYQKILKIISN